MRYVSLWIVVALGCSVGPEVGAPISPPHCASVLPTTRNRDYTDADPVIPGDLDDIQDCIIGAKHPELEFGLSGFSFVVSSPTALPNLGPAGFGAWGNGTGAAWTIYATIPRPAGTRITRYQIAYNRHTAAAPADFIEAQLVRGPWDHGLPYPETGAEMVAVDTFDDDATVGATTQERVVNHVMLSGWTYYLSIHVTATLDAHAPLFYGARYFADRL